MKTIYRNVNSGIELTEKEYDDLLQREAEEGWKNLDDEEKSEWSSKERFIERYNEGIDTDFEEVEIED